MSETAIPGVGTLTSSALDDQQISTIFQGLLLQMLGVAIDPADPVDPGYALVRLDWPTPGQPGFLISEDIAFIACVPETDEYDEQAEPAINYSADGTAGAYTRTTVYTRVWRASFAFYGPNSFDRARQVKACTFLPFVGEALAASGLYLLGKRGTPRRAPELFQNQWWPRTDFSVRFNEQVTETLNLPAMSGVELILEDASGILYDQVITVPLEVAFGDGTGFGDGPFSA